MVGGKKGSKLMRTGVRKSEEFGNRIKVKGRRRKGKEDGKKKGRMADRRQDS